MQRKNVIVVLVGFRLLLPIIYVPILLLFRLFTGLPLF